MKDNNHTIFSNINHERLNKKIKLINSNINPKIFYLVRILTTISIFIIVFIITKHSYILAPIISIIYYILFEFIVIEQYISLKNNILEKDALEYFQILLLNLKSTTNLKQSIINTNEVLNNNSIQKHMVNVINQTNLGKSLKESLESLEEQIPSQIINNIINILINIKETGTNLEDNINNQLILIKENEYNIISSNYKKIPLKLLIACIICITIYLIFNIIIINIS